MTITSSFSVWTRSQLPKVRLNWVESTIASSLVIWHLLCLYLPPSAQIPMPVISCKVFIPVHHAQILLPSSGCCSCPLRAAPSHRIRSSFAVSEPNPQCSKDMWYGFFQLFSCGSYNIIKNPLNFNVPYKICALVKASTDNYFWWINQEDKYVWSSCCSIQFLLYTSPAGAIIVMFQLVVSRASSHRSFGATWTLNYMGYSQGSFSRGKKEPCVVAIFC